MTFQISVRGLNMLRMFIEAGRGFHLRYEDARAYDQRPFRSMLIRGYIAYRPGRGFHITPEGRGAWDALQHTSVMRGAGQTTRPLTSYFDPAAYGIREARDNVHVLRKSA